LVGGDDDEWNERNYSAKEENGSVQSNVISLCSVQKQYYFKCMSCNKLFNL